MCAARSWPAERAASESCSWTALRMIGVHEPKLAGVHKDAAGPQRVGGLGGVPGPRAPRAPPHAAAARRRPRLPQHPRAAEPQPKAGSAARGPTRQPRRAPRQAHRPRAPARPRAEPPQARAGRTGSRPSANDNCGTAPSRLRERRHAQAPPTRPRSAPAGVQRASATRGQHVRDRGAARLAGRPRADNQQHRDTTQPIPQIREKAQRRAVGPMRIIDQQRQRPAASKIGGEVKEAVQGDERSLRPERQRRALGERNIKQRRDMTRHALEVAVLDSGLEQLPHNTETERPLELIPRAASGVNPAARAWTQATATSALLPIPAGPSTTTARPSPPATAPAHSRITASSTLRSRSSPSPGSAIVPITAIQRSSRLYNDVNHRQIPSADRPGAWPHLQPIYRSGRAPPYYPARAGFASPTTRASRPRRSGRSQWTIRASTRRGRADARFPRAKAGVYARALVRVVPSRCRPNLGESANFTRKRRAAPSPRRRPPVLPPARLLDHGPESRSAAGAPRRGRGVRRSAADQLADPATRVSFEVNLGEVRLRETG